MANFAPKDFKRKTVKVSVPELFDGEIELPTFDNVGTKLLKKLQGDSDEQLDFMIQVYEKYLPADQADFITDLPPEKMGKVFEAWGEAQDIEGPKDEAK